MLWFSHKYLVEIFGTAWLFRNVVDRKHTNAREARTLVPKLKMSLARNTADLRDPEFKKSLIAFSMEVKGFPLLLLLPIVSLIWYLIWNKMSLLTLSNSLQSTFKLFSSFSLELPTLLFLFLNLYYLQYYWKKIVTRKLPLNRTLLLFQLIFSKAAHVHCRCWITVLQLLGWEREPRTKNFVYSAFHFSEECTESEQGRESSKMMLATKTDQWRSQEQVSRVCAANDTKGWVAFGQLVR